MTRSTTTRRVRAAGGFGLLMLQALVLAGAALLSPAAALAADERDRWSGGPNGPGGAPNSGGPDGANGGPDAVTWETGSAATTTTTSDVNLRSGPSAASEALAVIPVGTAVQITGGWQDGFVPVVANGTWGFISGDYLGNGAAAATEAANVSAETATPATAATAVTDGPLPVVIATDAVVADDAARSPEIVAIIYAAADAYGQLRADMLRVAACESNLDPSAVNEAGGSYGLFQFLPSTWATTPYADQDIFDPVASANAAAWMWSVGRRAEWVCQ